jgi:LytS/YehU family sensor histidine kinase
VRLASIVCEQVERISNSEMQLLISQAELRSLQAQINPHFLFNALNTLTNLASLFRYSFSANRGMICIDEELMIVRAYLAIEELRLGGKLATEIDVDEAAPRAEVPVLSIQPLVENAVKHGVASRPGPGLVRLSIRKRDERIAVKVFNSGSFGEPAPDRDFAYLPRFRLPQPSDPNPFAAGFGAFAPGSRPVMV